MATRKQCEDAYDKVCKAIQKCYTALRYAEGVGALEKTEGEDYKESSPYYSLWEMRSRADDKFQGPIAAAVMNEIKYGRKK